MSALDHRNVDQVRDKAGHARRESLDHLGACTHDGIVRSLSDEHRRAHRDAAEQRANVVADHGHERVAHRERLVRAQPFGLQVQVGRVTFDFQQFHERPPPPFSFENERGAFGVSLAAQHLILVTARVDHCERRGALGICKVTRCMKNVIGPTASALDDCVGIVFDGRSPSGQLRVRLLAFRAKTLVGRLAFGVFRAGDVFGHASPLG